jgi:hypothetical protein
MSKAVKYVERAVTVAAQGAWFAFERLNRIALTLPSHPSGPISRC